MTIPADPVAASELISLNDALTLLSQLPIFLKSYKNKLNTSQMPWCGSMTITLWETSSNALWIGNWRTLLHMLHVHSPDVSTFLSEMSP